MKNIFKKGLVVLVASLFATSVLAVEATTTTTTTTPAGNAMVKTTTVKKVHKRRHCKMVRKCCKKNGVRKCRRVCQKAKACKKMVKKVAANDAQNMQAQG